jgi:hypothetical protein
MIRLLQSPPMASARWLVPAATNCAAVIRANMNPAHAAWMSNAGQFSLSRSCTRFPVEGKHMSGVKVATTSRSTSDGSQPAAFTQRVAAWVHRSLVAWCGSANRRSWIPVRLTIHSGSNPCVSCKSRLLITLSGT